MWVILIEYGQALPEVLLFPTMDEAYTYVREVLLQHGYLREMLRVVRVTTLDEFEKVLEME